LTCVTRKLSQGETGVGVGRNACLFLTGFKRDRAAVPAQVPGSRPDGVSEVVLVLEATGGAAQYDGLLQ
jgi:hypothetical protein